MLKLIFETSFINVLIQEHKPKSVTFAETDDLEMIGVPREVIDSVFEAINKSKKILLRGLL
jgi:hypothetical protein